MTAVILAIGTLALLAVRIYAAQRIGFGDAEALYACYARHPQPVYLDHPGLVGVVARLLGGGDAPSPFAAHLGTALLSTAAPSMTAQPGSPRALLYSLASGFAVGLACDAKASGVLLLFGLALAWASAPARPHRHTFDPWAGLVVALVVFAPVVWD